MGTSKHVTDYRIRVKQEMINITGGECQVCGYKRHQNALEFHHLDPSTKSFSVSEKNSGTIGRERKFEEIRKCVLLCSNCHKELHAGLIDCSTLILIYNEELASEYLTGIIKKKPTNCSKCNADITKYSVTGMCPSCSYASHRVVDRPDRAKLKELIRHFSFVDLGKQYGVSDNAVRKWCKAENLPSTKKEINSYSDENWSDI